MEAAVHVRPPVGVALEQTERDHRLLALGWKSGEGFP